MLSHDVTLFFSILISLYNLKNKNLVKMFFLSDFRAVWLIFLLTSALMVVTVVHMVTGVLAERAFCEPLKNPNDNRMFELVDEYLQIKRVIYPENPNADISIGHIIK